MNIDFSGKECTVLGLGISNRPLIGFLLDHGARVIARDQKPFDEKDAQLADYRRRGVEFICGEQYLERITGDYVFRSPGIRPDLPGIRAAIEKGALLTSEMELFFDLCPAKIFAVTGSDGKTTTTTLTYKLLEAAAAAEGRGRKVYVGGNIGTPLLPRVMEMTAQDYVVVELSSFQLMTMHKPLCAAAITNLSPNHLNWHTDMDEYTSAKQNIYRGGADRVVLNADNPLTASLLFSGDGNVAFSRTQAPGAFPGAHKAYIENGVICYDGRPFLPVSDILLPGDFNVENYLCAIALTAEEITPDMAKALARTFGGVEHRNEFVREAGGVRYYNSSIDSSPSRTMAALRAYPQKPILICGGRDKHVPFDGLAEEIFARAKALVLTGEARELILAAMQNAKAYTPDFPILVREDFTDAVRAAASLARAGDTVLLSPACTSFDAFKNFEERGKTFKSIVNEL